MDIKIEFRAYHDSMGNLLFYTCEQPAGEYIVIDALEYAKSRPDVKIVNGELVQIAHISTIQKLSPAVIGTICAASDVSIVVDANYSDNTITWNYTTHE